MPETEYYDLQAVLAIKGTEQLIADKRFALLQLEGADYRAKYIHIKKCEFSVFTSLKNVDLASGVLFEDCDFKDGLYLSGIKAGMNDRAEPPYYSIIFRNCRFDGLTEFLGPENRLDYGLNFQDCTFSQKVFLKGIDTRYNGIRFSGCTINNGIEIGSCKLNEHLEITECQFKKHIHIEDSSGTELRFMGDNDFSGFMTVRNSFFNKGISFFGGIFREEIYFKGVGTEWEGGLTLEDSQFDKTFYINFGPDRNITAFALNGCKFLNGLQVNTGFMPLSEKPRIRLIELQLSSKMTGNIVFGNMDVKSIDITGFNASANISFNLMEAERISIRDFINAGGLIFSHFKASDRKGSPETPTSQHNESSFYASFSNFGKAQFFQAHLDSFDRVIWHNVIITEISTSAVSWFTPAQLEMERLKQYRKELKAARKRGNEMDIKDLRRALVDELNILKEIYRQLKFASQKQGDIPLSLEFQRHEMNYYKQAVALRRPRQWSEYLILWSSASNNYGQSWLRAFFGLVIFSLLSYLPVGFYASEKLDYGHFAASSNDLAINFEVLWANAKMWIILLNPTHRIRDLSDSIDLFPPVIYVFDLLSRVIVSYFIFQMVSAFRKFSK